MVAYHYTRATPSLRFTNLELLLRLGLVYHVSVSQI
jgi:hypothetical protein